jgi:hypothetical protein
MTANNPSIVVGIFEKPGEAAEAIRALQEAGFRNDQIGLAAREWAEELAGVRVDLQHNAAEGAAVGALAGGGVGVVAGALGAALVPGVGPVLAGALLGGAAGAAFGTFAGPFIALGLSDTEAQRQARHVEKGYTVVLVRVPPERKDEARAILIEHGAYDDRMTTNP